MMIYLKQASAKMALFSCPEKALLVLFLTLLLTASTTCSNFQDLDITWGGDRGKILDNGDLLTLTLDAQSGSGFESRNQYLFGKMDMQLKLVPGNSAGTVTALYMSSEGGSDHDEIDFEFLGNLSGEPYTVHTNVYVDGKGEREQQFHLWFDPTLDFHTYSILWNPQTILFSVDKIPIREFKNLENKGVPFPTKKAMKVHSSIWNADEWATRGGLIRTDWAQAPFSASYRNFHAQGCTNCTSIGPNSSPLGPYSAEKIKWVQKNFMIYNYCTDSKRFPQGFPPECYLN